MMFPATYCADSIENRKGWRKARDEFAKLKSALVADGWVTPNTYDRAYVPCPEGPGVYLLLAVDRNFYDNGFVAYVGMSMILTRRIGDSCGDRRHSVIREIDSLNLWPQRWIKETEADQLRATERFYIEKFDPPFNIIGRRKGFR